MAALKFDVDIGWSWTVCAAGFIVEMLPGGMSKALGLMYLAYLDLFDQGEAATGWFTFAFGITIALVAPFGGYVADALDHSKKRIVLGVFFTLITLVVALAGYMPNLPLTILMFAILGLAIGLEDPIAMSMIIKYFDKWRTVAFGVIMIGVGTGGLVFPLIYNAAAETFGFRGTMLILAGVWFHGVFMAVVTWPLPTKPKSGDHIAGDTSSKELSALDLTSIAEINEDLERRRLGKDSTDTDSTNIEVKTDDSVNEEKRETGLKNECQKVCGILENYRKFLTNSRVPLLLLSCELGAFAYLGGYFLIPLLAKEFGLSNSDVSYIFTTGSLVDMAVKIPIGLLVDKVGISKGIILVVSSAVYGVGVMILSFINNPYVLYGHALLIGGFGGNIFQLLIPLFVDVVDESQKGTAAASLAFLAGTAAALLPIILGAVKTSFGSYVHSLRACAIAALLAAVLYCGNVMIAAIKTRVSSRS